jgi:anti-anti-sigma factor
MTGLESSACADALTPTPMPSRPTLFLVPGSEPSRAAMAGPRTGGTQHVRGESVELTCTASCVGVSGQVDWANAGLLYDVLEIATADGHGATVDLSGLSFIDLAGVRALVEIAVLIGPGNRLTLVSSPPMLRRILDVTGMAPPGRFIFRSE